MWFPHPEASDGQSFAPEVEGSSYLLLSNEIAVELARTDYTLSRIATGKQLMHSRGEEVKQDTGVKMSL